jgi:hypothetical protein
MTKLPEGRKPLPKEWFIDRAKAVTSPEKKDKEETIRRGYGRVPTDRYVLPATTRYNYIPATD